MAEKSASEASILLSEFDQALEISRPDLRREARAWDYYCPINHSTYGEDDLKYLRDVGRPHHHIDIIGEKIRTKAGSLLSDLPDPGFTPMRGQMSQVVEACEEQWYSDKSDFKFEDTLLYAFESGLVHRAEVELFEDWDTCHEARLALGLIPTGFLLRDPYWLSRNDRDCDVAWRVRYYNPVRLWQTYKKKSEEIRAAIAQYKRGTREAPPSDINRQQQQLNQGKVGDQYEAIEKHYLEHIETKRLLGRQQGKDQWIPFPIHPSPDSPDARELFNKFADKNQVDWTTVIVDHYGDSIHWVSTFCRELADLMIEPPTKSKIQIGGLPYFQYTAHRVNGKCQGDVELLQDISDIVDKRESMISEFIAKAGGGSGFVDEQVFADDEKYREWMKNKNKPGHMERVDMRGVAKIYEMLGENKVPDAAYTSLNQAMQTYLPLISGVTDAMSGQTSSEDNGILYERKFQTYLIGNTLRSKSVRQFIHNIADGYTRQYPITYNHERHPNMEVQRRGHEDEDPIILNQESDDGMIVNDAESMGRLKVILEENVGSATMHGARRSMWVDILKTIANEQAPLHKAFALTQLFKNMPNLSDEESALRDTLNDMFMMQARLQTVSQIAKEQADTQGSSNQSMQLDIQAKQLQDQINQLMNPSPAPAGPGAPAQPGQAPVQQVPNQTEAAPAPAGSPPAQTGPAPAPAMSPAESIA